MKQAESLKGYRGAMMGIFDPGIYAKKVFGEQYDNSFYGTACAYLLRRFGPSEWGCDPYKELTHYILTTEMDEVMLTVRPGCSVSTSFGYYVSSEIYEKSMKALMESGQISRKEQKEIMEPIDCPIRGPVVKALHDAIDELKKPINVRDWFFNIVGRVKDGDSTEEIVDYSSVAGYGITKDYFNKFNNEDENG